MSSKQVDLVITNGQLVTPSGIFNGDLVCHDGKIIDFNHSGYVAKQHIDATGLHVLPGLMDTQVHFREPGMEYKETIEAGTRGAVLGGITGVFEMPNTNPLTLTETDLSRKLHIAEQTAWCNYAFYMGGSHANLENLAELERLPGCAGIKVFMGSSFGDLLADEDELLLSILQQGKRRVAIHAEDEARLVERKPIAEAAKHPRAHPEWRDVESALRATQRIVSLARKANRRLHLLHISTADELRFLSEHKDLVTVEALPQHLVLHAPECYEQLGSLSQMNPPIRDKPHQDALWNAIQHGIVDVMGSDHAPHTLEEKHREYPNSPSGMVGVQTTVPLMLNAVNQGKLSLLRLVDLLCAGPARVFGLVGKGRLAIGYDADITLVDLNATHTIRNDDIASVAGWSPFDGWTLRGKPTATIIHGDIVMRDGELFTRHAGRPIRFDHA